MMKSLVMNPILSKELRSRMRSFKLPLLISVYLSLLSLIALAYYWMQSRSLAYDGFNPDIGPQIYVLLATFQLLLLAFVAPALTAGVINGERERQTFDLLLCTRLSPASIVLNKLLASISLVVLLIISSLPVFGIVYFYGGVLMSDIGRVFLIYLATAVTLGVIGIFCSSFFKRTQISMVVSYLAVFFLIVGTLIIAVFMRSLGENQGINPDSIPFITYFNPLMALYSIFPSQGPGMDIIYSIIGRGQSLNMMVASNGMA
jgi:ABC-type transport system involved in multi-copper enzyme maturation permease subunit